MHDMVILKDDDMIDVLNMVTDHERNFGNFGGVSCFDLRNEEKKTRKQIKTIKPQGKALKL